jgi:hypothetical protein
MQKLDSETGLWGSWVAFMVNTPGSWVSVGPCCFLGCPDATAASAGRGFVFSEAVLAYDRLATCPGSFSQALLWGLGRLL